MLNIYSHDFTLTLLPKTANPYLTLSPRVNEWKKSVTKFITSWKFSPPLNLIFIDPSTSTARSTENK